MPTHELRTWPGPFECLLDGTKRHEVRKNDRDFHVGDVLRLREWDPNREGHDSEKYTGRELWARVSYLTEPGTWGIPADVCVMSVEILASSDGHDAMIRHEPKHDLKRNPSKTMRAVVLCTCTHTRTLHPADGHCTFCECVVYVPED
jgi:hypothetical protein